MHTLAKICIPWGQLFVPRQIITNSNPRNYFSLVNKKPYCKKIGINNSVAIKKAKEPQNTSHSVITQLNDSSSYVEYHSNEQVAWPSSSFHQSEAEVALQRAK